MAVVEGCKAKEMMKVARGQRGTTLLELMVALVITVVVVGGTLSLIFQEYRGTAVAKTAVTAARQIGNAARSISQDGMMAETTDLVDGSPPVDTLTLNWVERYEFTNLSHSSSYFISGNQLRRDYDGTVTVVARDISSVEFSRSGRLISVTISSTPQWWGNETTVQKTYRIYPRAMAGG